MKRWGTGAATGEEREGDTSSQKWAGSLENTLGGPGPGKIWRTEGERTKGQIRGAPARQKSARKFIGREVKRPLQKPGHRQTLGSKKQIRRTETERKAEKVKPTAKRQGGEREGFSAQGPAPRRRGARSRSNMKRRGRKHSPRKKKYLQKWRGNNIEREEIGKTGIVVFKRIKTTRTHYP